MKSNHNSSNNVACNPEHKILTLKCKQKVLKEELKKTLCHTMSFREAFQTEMDLRTKLDEKLDNLRTRYEVISL